jgi:uncharacterized glyoxalase superfamily protein PhnB
MKEGRMDSTLGQQGWQFVTPQLPVADVRETQAYYRDVLGFKVAWIYQEDFSAVYHGTTEVFFSQEAGKIRPCWNFVRVEDADAILATYRESGAKIIEEIASQPWGMREFTIEDNNGHRFRIGHAEGPVVDPAGSAS